MTVAELIKKLTEDSEIYKGDEVTVVLRDDLFDIEEVYSDPVSGEACLRLKP